MGTPTDKNKPRMAKMTFCPSFEEEEDDWKIDEEEEENESNNVGLSDTLEKDEVANASISEADNGSSDGEDMPKVSVSVVDNVCSDGEDMQKVSDSEGEKVGSEEEDDDDYYEIEGIAMDLSMIVEYPTMREIEFETSCATCEKQAGPPVNCCSAGHVICDSCLEAGQKTCGAEMVSSDEGSTEKCMARFFGIDTAIQNTPYFREFMKSFHYECGLKHLGCDAVLSGMEIFQHEFLQCPFRFIKYCEFRCAGCPSTFDNLKENFEHLVDEHNLPIQWNSDEAHFNVKFNPEKLFEMNGYSFRDIPFIQAAVGTSDKHYVCLLMTEDLADDKTRLWFLKVPSESENHFTTVIRIYPPGGEDALEDTITMQLAVVSEIRNVNNLMEPVDGKKYYADFDNKMLEKYSFVENGNHYFGLLVVMIEHMKKPEAPKSEVQKLKEELAEKEKLRDSLEAIPPRRFYDDLDQEDEESERNDRLKELRGEISYLIKAIKYMEKHEEARDTK